MKAVIMESTPSLGTMLTFPVGNELLIDHLLLALKQQAIREVAVVSCEQDPYVRELVCRTGRSYGMTVRHSLSSPTFYQPAAGLPVRRLAQARAGRRRFSPDGGTIRVYYSAIALPPAFASPEENS